MDSPPEPDRRAGRRPLQARAQRTRQRVLESAVLCFEAHGFDETTTAMIAQRAGVAVGTVYGYFKDKRAILLELLDTMVREEADAVIARLDPASWEGNDPLEWTRSLIDMVFHTQRLRPGIQRIVWERYFKDPAFRAAFDQIRETIRVAIDRFLDALEREGVARPLVDRELASSVILNAVQWNATQALLRGDPEEIDHAAHATAELILRYVFKNA
jgi:AcrR family transcriptional regulator